MPADDMRFELILQFKRDNAALLLDLRAELDELYAGILNSCDFAHQSTVAHDRLRRLVASTWAAIDASSGRFWRSRITAVLQLGANVAAGAAGAAELLDATRTPAEHGPAAGVALGALTYAWKTLRTPKLEPGPCAYLYKAADERVLKRF